MPHELLSTSTPRRRCRKRCRSSFPVLCASKAVLILVSLHSLHEGRAWTASKTVSRTARISISTAPDRRVSRRRRIYASVHWLQTIPAEATFLRQTRVETQTRETAEVGTTSTEEEKETDDASRESKPIPNMAWHILAGNVATCLMASDQKRATGMDGGSTGWTSWIEESSAFRLQQCVNQLVFGVDVTEESDADTNSSRDDTLRWLKWMKATPSPMVVELSEEFREAVDVMLTPDDYRRAGLVGVRSRSDFLSRIGCRLVILPSGQCLRDNLKTPPGAMVYGKLLYGGVTRYRILGGAGNNGGRRPPRRAGERTSIMPMNDPTTGVAPYIRGWLQYGGPERNYQAVDMGPCGLMEITILPKDLRLPVLSEKESSALEPEIGRAHV